MKKWFARIVVAAGGIWVLLAAGMFAAMKQPPPVFGSIMKYVPRPLMFIVPFPPLWKVARAGSLRPGDLAPDFELPLQDGSAKVLLSSHRGVRPVMLVFGSYT